MSRTSVIKISEETRKKLITDLAKVQEDGYDIPNINVENLVSRAQAFPENHLLDIMYQDGLKEAVKTLISYYAFPVVNFDQEYPMHTGFFNVFRFCAWMVVSSLYDDSNVDGNDLEIASSIISSRAAVMMIPELKEICGRNVREKKEFLALFDILRKNWNEDLFGSNIFWLLLNILDFPAIKFVDTPVARVNFAIWLKQLTAFWPEDIWNWDDFSC